MREWPPRFTDPRQLGRDAAAMRFREAEYSEWCDEYEIPLTRCTARSDCPHCKPK